MKVRPEALAVWDAADEAARRALIDQVTARATKEAAATGRGGWSWIVYGPELEVIRARDEPHLSATIASHYRIYHQAQSGSDWGDHVVEIVETSIVDGKVIERALYLRSANVTEHESDGYDDAGNAQRMIDSWLADGAVKIEHALVEAHRRADSASRSKRQGWPSEVFRPPVVEVVRARTDYKRTIVATCTTLWISFRAHAGSDWTTQFVILEEARIEDDTIETKVVREEEAQYVEQHDDAAFTRSVIDRWLA